MKASPRNSARSEENYPEVGRAFLAERTCSKHVQRPCGKMEHTPEEELKEGERDEVRRHEEEWSVG